MRSKSIKVNWFADIPTKNGVFINSIYDEAKFKNNMVHCENSYAVNITLEYGVNPYVYYISAFVVKRGE